MPDTPIADPVTTRDDTTQSPRPPLDELTVEQCEARMESILEEQSRIHNRDDQTEDDERRFRELTVEFDRVDERRRHLRREHSLRRIRRAVHSGTVEHGSDERDADPWQEPRSVSEWRDGRADPYDLTSLRTHGRSYEQIGSELKARAKSAIEKMPGMSDSLRAGATKIVEVHDDEEGRLARHALVTGHPDYLRAWVKMARAGGPGNVILDDAERVAVIRSENLKRAMSLTDSAGGYLVPFQLDPTVIITSDGSHNEIRRIARQVVATGDVWNGVSAGAVTWTFAAEAAEASDNAPTFAGPAITVRKAHGFVPISIEALADAANVTTEVGRLLAQGRDDLEAQKFITGAAGSNEPIGVVTALAATDGQSPDYTIDNAGAEGVFGVADVFALYNALPARYRMRASWLANNALYSDVRQFASSDGYDLWERLAGDRPANILGRPVYEAEAMDYTIDTGATANNYSLVFGDFEHYVIADRLGMTVELIPHLFHTDNNLPTGQRGWYAYYRVGADSVNDAAFRLLNLPTAA